jgi:hypothetical protein
MCWRTFANMSWRSVQTFLVLLHTEAGGTPAFQSAPLRGKCCRLRRHWAFWFCRCVLAIQLSACADATAWQSVAHLTITNMSWRSVQTFLVLLHTEAGGPPAFQSAPLRGKCCRLRRHWAFWFCRCVFRPRCRRVRRRNRPAVGYPPYVVARRSVTHLTITNAFHAPFRR